MTKNQWTLLKVIANNNLKDMFVLKFRWVITILLPGKKQQQNQKPH